MPSERYCAHCGERVACRAERREIPGTARSMLKLFCPTCGRDLGSVFDDELRLDKVQGVARP